MATLHDEAREIYKRLNKRHKQTLDPLDGMLIKILTRCMKQIPEHKEGGLHPLHRELILCFQKTIRTEKRDRSETLAFQKVVGDLTMDQVKLLQWFYRLNKSKDHDERWHRKGEVKALCNSLQGQLEFAEKMKAKQKRFEPVVSKRPDAPEGWRSRAPGKYSEDNYGSWDLFWKSYPDMAQEILDGKDLS